MSGKTVKLYELCTKDSNRLWSPFVWRTKLALLHKGLKVETIPWRLTEKDKIKFADSEQVPVLVDDGKPYKESFDIAVYLEKTYPNAPSLFDGKGGQAACKFIEGFAEVAIMQYFAALLPDIWNDLDEKDQGYFRESREKAFGGKLEDVAKNPEAQVKKLREALEPLRVTLGEQSFVGGDSPNYGDYIIASILLTGKAVSKFELLEKDDPVLSWLKKILSKYEDSIKDVNWAWKF